MTVFKKPGSVKGTLLALLLPAGILLMAMAWLVHGLLLDRMARTFLESRLMDEAAFLEHQIRNSQGTLASVETGDYFQDVFHHAFAIRSPAQTLVSPDSWNQLLLPLLDSDTGGTVRVTKSGLPQAPSDILAYRTSFKVGSMPVTVIVSEDLGALTQSQKELHVWTAIVSVLLIILLVVVIWFGINLSMRPVIPIKTALKRLQAGENSRIDVQAPEEFRPLVQQLNQLLDSMDQRLERSREAVANLSHSVKTPIAAVRQILEDEARPLGNELRHQMAARLDDINRQLESEMRRSQFAGPQVGKSACPVKQARELLWLMGRLYPDTSFELSSSLPDDCRWPIEEHDLSEVMGNLLDNAGKWSNRCVELQLKENQGIRQLVVTDDGPGVDDHELSQLGQRGLRLDQQMPGHGLGLAIVEEIVSRYDGTTRFNSQSGGGLRVTIEL